MAADFGLQALRTKRKAGRLVTLDDGGSAVEFDGKVWNKRELLQAGGEPSAPSERIEWAADGLVVLAVPQKSERRHSRMIARLGSEDPMGHGIAVEVAKRRANHVAKRASRSLGKRQQRIQRSRTALLADSAVPKERKNPVRSMLPVIAKAEDFVAGAKQVAKDAVRDTVKRSNEVFKELRKAAAAENVSREVEDMDELGQVARGLRAPGADALGLKENFGLALLPGWPVAQLQSAFRHRARQCTVVDLPLLPPLAFASAQRESLASLGLAARETLSGRDLEQRNLRLSSQSRLSRFSRSSRTSELTEELKSQTTEVTEGKSEGPEEALYMDEDADGTTSDYSRSNSGWSVPDDGEDSADGSGPSGPSSPGIAPEPPKRGSRGSQRSMTSGLWLLNRASGDFDDLRTTAKKKLQRMNTSVQAFSQAAAGYASEAAAKAVNKVKNFALQRKLRGMGRREFTSRVLVRKVVPGSSGGPLLAREIPGGQNTRDLAMRCPELGALVASALIAGSMFLFTSLVKDAFPPLSLVMFRMLLGSAGLLAGTASAQAMGWHRSSSPAREEVLYLCAIGAMNTVLPYTLYAAALGKGESVSCASALAGATPVFAAGLMALSGKLTLQTEGPGLLLGLLGVLLIVFRRGRWSHGSFQGVALQVLGVFFKASAACLAGAKNARKDLKASVLLQALLQALCGAALAAVLSLLLDARAQTPHWLDPKDLSHGGYGFLFSVTSQQWLCLVALSLMGSCVVYLLQFFLLARVGAVRQTLMDQLALVIGVVEGGLFRGEWRDASFSELLTFLFGAACVLVATALLYHPSQLNHRTRSSCTCEDAISLETMASEAMLHSG
ncbi:unnamed protein product [Durusdinium trenchii]|uniref:EamA domain-containing protein n=1 Tax=Durusdinium trenchii TaxID=1381693 RepID=A0ABP0QS44_9DINO